MDLNLELFKVHPPFIPMDTFYPVPVATESPSANNKCSVAGWGRIRYVL